MYMIFFMWASPLTKALARGRYISGLAIRSASIPLRFIESGYISFRHPSTALMQISLYKFDQLHSPITFKFK